MMIEDFETALQLANEFLPTKERENYFKTEAIYEGNPDYSYMLTPLTDDEVRQIKALKERYGDDFVNHLDEVIDDPDVISDMFYGDPVDIDLETIHHQYKFNIRSIHGEKVSSSSFMVELSDEDYSKLLAWHLFDSHLLMNTLFYRDEDLYKKIMRAAMFYHTIDDFFVEVDDPFVVTLDEALADTAQIQSSHNITPDIGYRYLPIY